MSTPTIAHTSAPSKNQFSLLANKDENDDDTVVISKKAEKTPNTDNDSTAIEYAISDSGATGHFLVEGAPVTNLQVADNAISITIPNGKSMTSTYTCNLDIPWLTNHVTEAHIVPGLAHSSLISTRKFCEAGYKVIFDTNEYKVYYKGKLVLARGKDNNTALWKLPINPKTKPIPNRQGHHIESLKICNAGCKKQSTLHKANSSLYTLPYKQNQLKYMHQAFFNAPIKMLIDAAHNNQLTGVPFINNADNIRKYLAP